MATTKQFFVEPSAVFFSTAILVVRSGPGARLIHYHRPRHHLVTVVGVVTNFGVGIGCRCQVTVTPIFRFHLFLFVQGTLRILQRKGRYSYRFIFPSNVKYIEIRA